MAGPGPRLVSTDRGHRLSAIRSRRAVTDESAAITLSEFMFRRLIGRFVGGVGIAAVMLMALGAPAAADTYTRQPGIDVQQYIFRIELKDGTRAISGQADIDLVFKTDGVA